MENSKHVTAKVLHNFFTKDRSTNFTKTEVDRLQMLVEKYRHILLCKKTDGSSTKQKDDTWMKIEKEFNANGETPRTIKQLKYKFDNLKRAVKKEASTERQKMIKTGGGRLTPPPTLPSEDNNWLKSMMSTSIDGHEAVYDDDVIPMTSNSSTLDQDIIFQIIVNDDKEDKSHFEEKIAETKPTESWGEMDKQSSTVMFDTSTPHSSLKRPMSSPLKRLAKKKKMPFNSNLIRTALQEKKLTVLEELHKLELDKIRDSIAQQKELHEQKIRQNEEKHVLEVLKLQLEVELLKKS